MQDSIVFLDTSRPLRSRADGTAEEVSAGPAARPAWLAARGAALRTETYETARLRHPGFDIYFVEGEWRAWAANLPAATDPDRAFLAFFRKFAESNPL